MAKKSKFIITHGRIYMRYPRRGNKQYICAIQEEELNTHYLISKRNNNINPDLTININWQIM